MTSELLYTIRNEPDSVLQIVFHAQGETYELISWGLATDGSPFRGVITLAKEEMIKFLIAMTKQLVPDQTASESSRSTTDVRHPIQAVGQGQ